MRKRNKFGLSHFHLTTGNMGYLYPLTWIPVIPGDTIRMRSNVFLRTAPLNMPVTHPVNVRIHHVFATLNQLWDQGDGAGEKGFPDFITGGLDGDDDQAHPVITLNSAVTQGTLHNYLGIPAGDYTGKSMNVNALPFRMYSHCWNHLFRDQHLHSELTIDTSDGVDSTTNTTLQRVCWQKDRYTASRPWEQLGSEVVVPLSGTAPIYSDMDWDNVDDNNNRPQWRVSSASGADKAPLIANSTLLYGSGLRNQGTDEMLANLAQATGMSINDLRLSFALQHFMENSARYGGRYSDYIRRYGIRPDDLRLREPLILGSGHRTVSFSPVLSHASESGGKALGDMAGQGVAALRSNRFRKFFNEHGIIMTFLSVIPVTVYGDMMRKEWFYETKEDYFQYELEDLGEQQVDNKEVYWNHSSPDDAFGYQSQYDEYRSMSSFVSAEMSEGEQYEDMHMARFYSGDPALNATFVAANPTNRIYQSTANDELQIFSAHQIQARRMMKKYARPAIL